ncbi:hypothetical protein V5O48_003880 [Marasmius crinis-equi]|uniref:CxC2-like cysteine cluster KDZ transposase-associated domain-containing protein n=1 Tax=Marasmius crinis-equi TaxID=585013 RepID=A0ABR3FRL2_9AGAR
MSTKRRRPAYKNTAKRTRLDAGSTFLDRVNGATSSGVESGEMEADFNMQIPGAFPLPLLDGASSRLEQGEVPKSEEVEVDRGDVQEEDVPRSDNVRNRSKEEIGLPERKAKRTVRSRYPNIDWKERYRAAFLDEIIRHKGRGDYRKQTRCSDCKAGEEEHEVEEGERVKDEGNRPTIRCRECFLQDLVCAKCCVRRHWDNPYHHVEVRVFSPRHSLNIGLTWKQHWTGSLFERTSLAILGLVMQLNHVSGQCSKPVKCYQHLLVIHTNGIHRVNIQFCGCHKAIPQHLQLLRRRLYPTNIKKGRISTVMTFQYLESLQIHTLTTKGSIHDFYRAAERLSDNTGLLPHKSRYRQLLRGIRQWRHLKLLLRGGKGQSTFVEEGEEEQEGSLILKCPSCPHPFINLPPNWQDLASGKEGFLYRLTLCLDANFRLKEQTVSSHSRDPALCDGQGYFVRRKPFERWLEENKKVEDAEDEISNCVPFGAITKQTSKFSKGLRYTGVAGVVCGRTDMIVKVANLNKGERFSIIDYVLGVAMQWWAAISWLLLCYDIACQYFRNFNRRRVRWPSHITLSPLLHILVAIGKLHRPGHKSENHDEFDLNLRPGAAHIDGESCERFWSNHNALSNATKTMGPGARQDLLESQFEFWNWEKYKGIGMSLRIKLRSATEDKEELREDHEDLTANLPKELVEKWEVEVSTWENAPAGKEKVLNPYEIAEEFVGQAEAMKELALEDEDRLKRGEVRYHATSPAGFIALCMDIRDKQEKLRAEVEERTRDPTIRQQGRLTDQRNALRRQILNLEEVRAVYMPGLAQYLRDVQGEEDVVEERAEDITVWMPSSVPVDCRKRVCVPGMGEVEAKLQKGRAHDALDGLRHSLRVKARMLIFKNENVRGQRDSGRANETLNGVAHRVNRFAERYRACRKAYYSLLCTEGDEELPKLEVSDVRNYRDPATIREGPGRRGTNELWEEGESEGQRQMVESEGTITGQHLIPLNRREWEIRSVHGTGETRKRLSWIWTHRGRKISLEDGVDDNELLREEWCKSRARMQRAEEEEMLVREEMRRTLAYLEWAADQWDKKRDTGEIVKKPLKEGRAAYAVEQAAIQRGLRDKFSKLWGEGPEAENADEEDDAEGFDGAVEDAADGLEEEVAIDDDDVYDF